MNVVDLRICTSLMLSTIMSICAQGEELIPATTFRYCLASPVLNTIGQMFLQKVSKTITKVSVCYLSRSLSKIFLHIGFTDHYFLYYCRCKTKFSLIMSSTF